ncbi:fimbrial protein [Pseudomonas sp. DWP3-1-2]|uniref:fimbrial protein n=1 Tax=Pseudomonas sp. DWP3-1-2 TaxID=2804645 RepID=UPI003CF989ED
MNTPQRPRWCQLLFVAVLLSPASCFALVCKTQGSGQTLIRDDLDSSVAIAATLPDGDIVWRSPRHDIHVECAKDGTPGVQEEIFVYLNPDNLQIGQGIRAGLTLGGVDYLQSGGRIATGQFLPVCHEAEADIDACPKAIFNLGFSVFIQKFGPTPPSGVASDLQDYRLFQLDSLSGPNPLPGHTFSYLINNLSGLRFVACDAQLQVVPETVEFGTIAIARVGVGNVIDRRPFYLTTRRSCDSPFSLGARFRAVTGTVSGDFLVPAANNGVGIRIVNGLGGTILRYNEPFHLADMLGDTQTASVGFNAELVWQTSAPKAGPFEAEVMVDLFYK